jgi:hypothetical protein
MDPSQRFERLDGPQRHIARRELGLRLLGELEDPQVLTHPGLCRRQPLGYAVDRQTRVEQPLVAARRSGSRSTR